MERIPVSEAREQISEILNRVAYRGERVVLHRRGKELAALIPMEDLEILLRVVDVVATVASTEAAPQDAGKSDPARDSLEGSTDPVPSGRLVDDSDASPWIPHAL
jgi:prevent-host-death family protein